MTSRRRRRSPKRQTSRKRFQSDLKKTQKERGKLFCLESARKHVRASRARINFAFFYKPFEEARQESPKPSLRRTTRCMLRFKGAVYTASSSNGRGAHEDDGRCARARGTLVSHLVRFHRQKCRRRICSFRHDAVAVDHPYCSPRESGSQTASRKGRRCE